MRTSYIKQFKSDKTFLITIMKVLTITKNKLLKKIPIQYQT